MVRGIIDAGEVEVVEQEEPTPAFREPLLVGRPNIGSREHYLELVGAMLDRRWLSNNGVLVQTLESRIADYLGVKHCVAMCNGTLALEVGARALGLKGEVIVPSYTFVATVHALQWQGIKPVFVDIDPDTHCLDPEAVRRAITPQTTGILAVHLWGRPAAVDALERIAREHNLKLMFDAAHAFGCTYRQQPLGNFGDCEVFSLHATKFLNSLEGGALTTNDDAIAERARAMRNFGFVALDDVGYAGTNGKMAEACAAMGLVNLDFLDAFIATNVKNHQTYAAQLDGITGLRLLKYDQSERNNHQYVVVEIAPEFAATRDELIASLHAENIFARKYFWPGCHRMMPYREMYPDIDSSLPHTNEVASRVVVLPTGTAVSTSDIQAVCSVIRRVARP
jgi:dTDP-4-amino-4,6-dideoxygalactose transaminase